MKKLLVLVFAGLTLAACADTSQCTGAPVWTADGIVCTGPGHG